ncbi:MAG: hypothetical protein U5L96_06660 [Owenweeksia sp.]|nr:hypothetical protein [Owenweeksia sp.]
MAISLKERYYIKGEEVVASDKPALNHVLRGGVLCNDSRIKADGERWVVEGDPTEAALISAAGKAGIMDEHVDRYYPRIDEIPFQSEYQFMATLHGPEEKILFLKGIYRSRTTLLFLYDEQQRGGGADK